MRALERNESTLPSGHTISLDGPEILARGGNLRGEVEVAADSLASAFFLPKWLLQIHARRQGWNSKSMADPFVVYQMSLRVGASYEATCVALAQHKIIDEGTRQDLVDVPRREIKAELLDGYEVENYFPDVWLLKDEGLTLEGQPEDLFTLRVRERGGAGYLWNTDGLRNSGFAILRDERDIPSPETGVGGPILRTFTVRSQRPSSGSFALEQRRPWQKTAKPHTEKHQTGEKRVMGWMFDNAGRLIARLQKPVNHREPFTPDDSTAFRDTLRPGDVLLVEGKGRFSGSIKYLTQSTSSPSALYVGPVPGSATEGETHVLIEANIDEGVVSAPLSKYLHRQTRICRPVGLSEADCAKVCHYAIERIWSRLRFQNAVDLTRYLFPMASGAALALPNDCARVPRC